MDNVSIFKFNLAAGAKEDGSLQTDIGLCAVRAGLHQLKEYEKKNPRNTELAWEIRLYKWILNHPDPKKKAEEYLKARHEGHELIRKRDVVKKLGWLVP